MRTFKFYQTIAATTTVSAIVFGLSGCVVFKEPSIDYLTSTVPDAPVNTAPAVVLPAEFPAVPLVNTDYVPGSLSQPTPQQWKVSVYGDIELWNSITAAYQVAGFLPGAVADVEGSKSMNYVNDTYDVWVTGSQPSGGRYQFAYTITMK
jgi:hypothetical protein